MNRGTWLIVGTVLALGGAGAVQLGAVRAPATREQAIALRAGPVVLPPQSVPAPSAQEETGWVPPSASEAPPDRRARRMDPAKSARARSAEMPAPAPHAANLPGREDRISQTDGRNGSAAPGGETSPGVFGSAPTAVAVPPDSAPPAAAPPHATSPSAAPAPPVLTAPVPISLEPPRHPMGWRVVVETPGLVAEARPEHDTARVRLRLVVHVDGTVGVVEVATSSGRPDLDAAAAASAQGWRFIPARRDGEPVPSRVLIWVAFVLAP